MAHKETQIVNEIMLGTSKLGTRLFRNVRGFFYTQDGVRALIDAAKSLNIGRILSAIKMLRQVRAGLQAAGSSDLIGFKPVLITQDMVGTVIAQLVALEIKTDTGAASEEQLHFIDFVQKNGGLSGVCRSLQDALKILHYPVD